VNMALVALCISAEDSRNPALQLNSFCSVEQFEQDFRAGAAEQL
jgi:hypothetical protein